MVQNLAFTSQEVDQRSYHELQRIVRNIYQKITNIDARKVEVLKKLLFLKIFFIIDLDSFYILQIYKNSNDGLV